MATAPAATAHIRFRCPHCGKTNKAPTGMIGCGGTCARCKGGVKVPAVGDRTAGPVMRESRIAKPTIEKATIEDASGESAGFSPTQMNAAEVQRSVQTLEELGDFVAKRSEKRHEETAPAQEKEEPRKAKESHRTPWWLWVLHLALPVATVVVIGSIYHARQVSPMSPAAVVEETTDGHVAAELPVAERPTQAAVSAIRRPARSR
jgi:hypothetical protein